jgi:predicted DNA-binding protein (MmcQ/YjbR family)
MNKQHWYTVLLDDSLDDEEIIKLVRTSFEIVNG